MCTWPLSVRASSSVQCTTQTVFLHESQDILWLQACVVIIIRRLALRLVCRYGPWQLLFCMGGCPVVRLIFLFGCGWTKRWNMGGVSKKMLTEDQLDSLSTLYKALSSVSNWSEICVLSEPRAHADSLCCVNRAPAPAAGRIGFLFGSPCEELRSKTDVFMWKHGDKDYLCLSFTVLSSKSVLSPFTYNSAVKRAGSHTGMCVVQMSALASLRTGSVLRRT